MRDHRGRRESRWWLAAWRVGGVAVLIAAVAGFARQATAAPEPVRQEPASLLQCDGKQYSVGEFTHAARRSTDTPEQIIDRWAGQRRVQLGAQRAVNQRIAFESPSLRDVAMADGDGATRSVLVMTNDQYGWRLEAIYECA